jgi:tetrahydromethanopterin S-methyltransferase subunit F
MNTNVDSPKIFKDVKIDIKIKLSALWVALMFCYTYADILGFYAPGNLEELLSGEIAGIQMTQGMLFGSAVLMVIPSMMIFLSLVMMAKANRLVNIIAGIVYLVVLVSTFFTGRNPAYYLFFAVVKAILLGLIVWFAWKWPKIES